MKKILSIKVGMIPTDIIISNRNHSYINKLLTFCKRVVNVRVFCNVIYKNNIFLFHYE